MSEADGGANGAPASAPGAVQDFFRLVKDGVTDYGIILMDVDGNITSWNAGAERIFQYKETEVLGKSGALIFTPEDRANNVSNAELETAKANGRADDERWHLRRDGSRFMASGVLTAVMDGGRMGLVKVLRDITERQKADLMMQQAHQYQTLAVLAGGFAHDFNNLLTSIMGNSTLAVDQLPASSPARTFLQEVVDSSRRAAELTQRLLAYAGRTQVFRKRLELSGMVAELAPVLKRLIPKHVMLDLVLAPSLPHFYGDEIQLDQVILDLVTNSVEALDREPGIIRVKTGIDRPEKTQAEAMNGDTLAPGDYVFVEVSDNGTGMDEETRHIMFEPFFTTKFLGRGLGLAAVSGILRKHNGAISVSSTLGKGTTIRAYFPVLT